MANRVSKTAIQVGVVVLVLIVSSAALAEGTADRNQLESTSMRFAPSCIELRLGPLATVLVHKPQ